jgi:hypothetical protein
VTYRTPALGRLVSAGGTGHPQGQQCGLCGAAIPADHRHVLATADQMLRCTCRACGLLFEKDAAANGRYQLVPQRRVRLDAASDDVTGDDVTGDDVTDLMGVPVGLVFLVRQPAGPVLANYPSPFGITRSALDDADWRRLLARWPVLGTMTPRVEAVLLNSVRGSRERWLVPIDDCYRLAAVLRRHWKGMSGGRDVWPAVSDFFARLARLAGRAAQPEGECEPWASESASRR